MRRLSPRGEGDARWDIAVGLWDPNSACIRGRAKALADPAFQLVDAAIREAVGWRGFVRRVGAKIDMTGDRRGGA